MTLDTLLDSVLEALSDPKARTALREQVAQTRKAEPYGERAARLLLEHKAKQLGVSV